MPEFELQIHQKYSIWEKISCTVTADSLNEAVVKALEPGQDDVEELYREEIDGCSDMLEPEDNGYQPTRYVYPEISEVVGPPYGQNYPDDVPDPVEQLIKDIKRIDKPLFGKQRQTLLTLTTDQYYNISASQLDHLEGIMALLDCIEDFINPITNEEISVQNSEL